MVFFLCALTLALFALFVVLAAAVVGGFPPLHHIDQQTLEFARSVSNPILDTSATWFTHLGATPASTVVATTFALVTAWRWRERTPVVMLAAATALATSLTRLLKLSFERIRPHHDFAVPPFEYTYAFPSGHSLNAVVISGIIAYLLLLHLHSTPWRVLVVGCCVVYPILIGVSRVLLGHHWLSDVLAGWILGGTCLLVVIATHRWIAANDH